MSNQNNSPSDALAQLIKPIVKEAVEEVLSRRSDPDRLLDASAAATLMAVSEDWLYRHAKKLPFTRRLGPKMLRFSSKDIEKYLATRK